MATVDDLNARITALEASHAELLAATKSIGATQRVLADALREYAKSVESVADDTNERTRGIEGLLAEIRNLLVRVPGRPD